MRFEHDQTTGQLTANVPTGASIPKRLRKLTKAKAVHVLQRSPISNGRELLTISRKDGKAVQLKHVNG